VVYDDPGRSGAGTAQRGEIISFNGREKSAKVLPPTETPKPGEAMYQTKRAPTYRIHPSIDDLASRIRGLGNDATDEVATLLREACLGKLKSYKLEDYLKRYASEEEKMQARSRWDTVLNFANRRSRSSVG
jgi:hypothetical protein